MTTHSAAAAQSPPLGRWTLCERCIHPVPTLTPRCAKCGGMKQRLPPEKLHATPQAAWKAALSAVREPARLAAEALRLAKKDRESRGERSVILASGRPRHWHIYQWKNLPGFTKTVSFSTGARAKPPVTTFNHRLLPGWDYAQDELWEMLQDLDALADGLGWPTQPTRGKPAPEGQGALL